MEFALWALALVLVPLVGSAVYAYATTHIGKLSVVNTDDWTFEEFAEDSDSDKWQ